MKKIVFVLFGLVLLSGNSKLYGQVNRALFLDVGYSKYLSDERIQGYNTSVGISQELRNWIDIGSMINRTDLSEPIRGFEDFEEIMKGISMDVVAIPNYSIIGIKFAFRVGPSLWYGRKKEILSGTLDGAGNYTSFLAEDYTRMSLGYTYGIIVEYMLVDQFSMRAQLSDNKYFNWNSGFRNIGFGLSYNFN